MSNERIDFSVLPKNTLVEFKLNWVWAIKPFSVHLVRSYSPVIRPLTADRYPDFWYFNDGSMVLPEGLVVRERYSDHDTIKTQSGLMSLYYTNIRQVYVVAFQILGALPQYKDHADEIGLRVVEV